MKNRDRYEYCTCCVCHEPEIISRSNEDWIQVKAIVTMQQARILKERYERYGSDKDMKPTLEEFLKNGSRRVPLPESGDGMRAHLQELGLVSNLKLTAKNIMKVKKRTGLLKTNSTVCWIIRSAKTDPRPKNPITAFLLYESLPTTYSGSQ